MSYAVAALVDIDDFIASSQAQGQVWARRQLRRADRAVHAAAFGRPGVTCRPQPPEEWLVMLTGADPEALMSEATALAEEVRARIVRETAWTATVSLGVPPRPRGGAEGGGEGGAPGQRLQAGARRRQGDLFGGFRGSRRAVTSCADRGGADQAGAGR
ncbi:hypothetical protein ACFQGX_16645 [Nonomuraea dietziae]|uniref:hypothetical protein n=1 Tax=Nonomuraea dietziae TaxID=65515 RepID=UPI00360E2E4D